MAERPDGELRRTLWGALAFVVIAGIMASDLFWDYLHGAGAEHLGLEGLVLLLALGGGVVFSRRWLALRREAEESQAEVAALRGEAAALEERVAALKTEAEKWKGEANDLIEGLGLAIDHQFERWGLSPAEREIGLLLLKGLSHQEVADLRGVSERTVRQQARSLYKKAGLTGRADLAAYFLEDLLLPRTSVKGAEDAR